MYPVPKFPSENKVQPHPHIQSPHLQHTTWAIMWAIII